MVLQLPLVTLIIPVLNGEKRIKRCLESIKNQTYLNIEIIVIDANSTDNTAKIAKEYGKVFSFNLKPFMVWGTPYQQNYGATKANGKYLYFVDDDMILPSDAVKSFVEKLEKENADSMIVPEISIGKGFWAKCKVLERSLYLLGDMDIESPRFHKKSVWNKLGGLDASMGGHYDWDLHIRLKENGYKVVRSNKAIYHDEGKLTLRKLIKKKFIYGKSTKLYIKKHKKKTQLFKSQFNLFRPAYFKNRKILSRNPIHTMGFLIMKITECISLFFGTFLSKRTIIKD